MQGRKRKKFQKYTPSWIINWMCLRNNLDADCCWLQWIRPLRWKPRKQPQRSKAQYSHASAFNGQLDFKFNSLTINVYPDLGQNASSQMKQPTFAYLLKGRWFSPACTCSRNVILFKNEAVRMKALLTNIELDIRYSSVLSHMLFLISAWRNTCRTSASL